MQQSLGVTELKKNALPASIENKEPTRANALYNPPANNRTSRLSEKSQTELKPSDLKHTITDINLAGTHHNERHHRALKIHFCAMQDVMNENT